jgi:hypothetical protein
VDPDLERALDGLKKAAEFARNDRFEMTDDYLELIARVEAMPENQSGVEKAHVWRAQQTYKEFFRLVRPVPDDM